LFALSLSVQAQTLEAPVLSAPEDGATGISLTPTLSWQPVTGAIAYVPWIEGVWSVVTTETTINVPSGKLVAGTTYSWNVRACSDINCHDIHPRSASWTFTTAGTAPLSAPVNPTPKNGATDVSLTPTLYWSPVGGAAGYIIQIIDAWTSFTTQSFIKVPPGKLTSGTLYTWHVKSCGDSDCQDVSLMSPWSNSWTFTTVSSVSSQSEAIPCIERGQACSANENCCISLEGRRNMVCSSGVCCDPIYYNLNVGDTCYCNGECASGICSNGKCVAAAAHSPQQTAPSQQQQAYSENGECPPGQICNPLNVDTFEELLDAVIGFIFWVGMALAPLMLIIAGFMFVTSGGSPEKVNNAKRLAVYTLIGLAVVIAAKGLIAVLKSILGVKEEAFLPLYYLGIAKLQNKINQRSR